MCSVIILIRPGHRWPVIVAANRDEMIDRPALPPGRHWPTRQSISAGLDVLGGGTWLGMNDHGVICGVLNRVNTLGPANGLKRESSIHCDALVSVQKPLLTDFVGSLDLEHRRSLDRALAIALGLA